MLNLDLIKARMAAITPSPWETRHPFNDTRVVSMEGAIIATFHANKNNNADFVAQAPTDIARLIAEVERLREQKQMLTMAIEDHYHVWQTSNDRLKETQNRLLWQQIGIGISGGGVDA